MYICKVTKQCNCVLCVHLQYELYELQGSILKKTEMESTAIQTFFKHFYNLSESLGGNSALARLR